MSKPKTLPAFIKEGRKVFYRHHGGRTGTGKIIEVYRRHGWWIIVHDKVANLSISLRPAHIELPR